MKVLLTGANGFVGSHILDALRARKIPAAILLRATSRRDFIQPHLADVDLRFGAVENVASLQAALAGVTHVIHAAGLTRARRVADFYAVNQVGTRNLIDAILASGEGVQRLVFLSSLAAHGPATANRPATEDQPPAPVSDYGRSKLAAEEEVRRQGRVPAVILRPPAVYGPRDGEFLRLFLAVQRGLAPRVAGGAQELSLVYARDLAEVIVNCLDHPRVAGRTFHVAGSEVVTATRLTELIAEVVGRRVAEVAVPAWALRGICAAAGGWARLSGRPSLLAHDKHRELLAPGWVCDTHRVREALGIVCPTALRAGLRETLAWYREHDWL